MIRTEDEVRDSAKFILGFDKQEKDVKQGTGQITTFNQLGFKGNNNKPDGWYLPNFKSLPAIILETKSENEDINLQKWVNELIKNCNIVLTKYYHVIGLLYNGKDIRVFKDNIEVFDLSKELQSKHYYLSLFNENKIDKQQIYTLTKKINDCLHVDFGIKNLYHRMIFTACALVAKRYDALLVKDMSFSTMKNSILSTLNKSLEESRKQNLKLDLLTEVYAEIKMNNSANQEAINNFIEWVSKISECVNSDYWNGEDVMGIFFNEFNRYKGKSESGQIFTPDHITSFMYRIINVNQNDRVLDATCGSGAFLVKAMCNMMKEAGGIKTKKSEQIRGSQLFGIEFDREIFALACANMLIHKDGKTNLEQLDTRSQKACEWIKSKNITKVLMNPPYERKYGCMKIVQNVLDNVPEHTECAFILPDKKLEKDFVDKKYGNKLLKNHTLKKIIKLPENLFFGVGITTSIFIFEAGVPHNGKDIFACYIEDDGLETVKNQGRQDIKGKWQGIEDKWIKIIRNPICEEAKYVQEFIQTVNPEKHLSYQLPEKPFEVYEEDFIKTMMDYEMFKQKIDVKEFNEKLLKKILYSNNIEIKYNNLSEKIDMTDWKEFLIENLFRVELAKGDIQAKKQNEGDIPLVSSGMTNNGICKYIEKNTISNIFQANLLTVDMFGKAFYQDNNFYAVGHGRVNILKPIYANTFNLYTGTFIATVIESMTSHKYQFNDMCSSTAIIKDTIKLPVTTLGEIDWAYMEKYMLVIEKYIKNKLRILQNL